MLSLILLSVSTLSFQRKPYDPSISVFILSWHPRAFPLVLSFHLLSLSPSYGFVCLYCYYLIDLLCVYLCILILGFIISSTVFYSIVYMWLFYCSFYLFPIASWVSLWVFCSSYGQLSWSLFFSVFIVFVYGKWLWGWKFPALGLVVFSFLFSKKRKKKSKKSL